MILKGEIGMEIAVKVVPKASSMLLAILSSILFFSILGIGIYLIYLLLKALRIYIKKNS